MDKIGVVQQPAPEPEGAAALCSESDSRLEAVCTGDDTNGEMAIEYVVEVIRQQVAEYRERAYERSGIVAVICSESITIWWWMPLRLEALGKPCAHPHYNLPDEIQVEKASSSTTIATLIARRKSLPSVDKRKLSSTPRSTSPLATK